MIFLSSCCLHSRSDLLFCRMWSVNHGFGNGTKNNENDMCVSHVSGYEIAMLDPFSKLLCWLVCVVLAPCDAGTRKKMTPESVSTWAVCTWHRIRQSWTRRCGNSPAVEHAFLELRLWRPTALYPSMLTLGYESQGRPWVLLKDISSVESSDKISVCLYARNCLRPILLRLEIVLGPLKTRNSFLWPMHSSMWKSSSVVHSRTD